jgi:hypothetical protein
MGRNKMDKTPKDFLPEEYLDDVDSIDENLLRKGSTLAYAKKVKSHGDRANGHLRRAIDKSETNSEKEIARALIEIRGMVGALTAVIVSGELLSKR